MPLKAVHVKNVPNLDQVSDDLNSPTFNTYPHLVQPAEDFMVIGHRGTGMNLLQSSDPRMKSIKENSILAFNAAGKFNLDFIEFDVQVVFFYLAYV